MAEEAAEEAGGRLRTGKLPAEVLARLLGPLGSMSRRDARLVLGAAVGEDAAVVSMEGSAGLLVAAADPITFPTDRIGWYAVHVNANDIAAVGATPRWFLATVLLPEGAREALAQEIMAQMVEACAGLGVTLVGGHTEVTYALPRPLVSGCMLGEVAPGRLVRSGGAQPGDAVLLLGSAGVEGTAVLAHEAAARLRAAGVGADELARARAFLTDPGISVVGAARAVCAATLPHALHDVTEGGVATGLRELAGASGAGLCVREEGVHVAPETAHMCAALGLDPWGLLGSGALLAAVAPGDVAAVTAEAGRQGIVCAAIGELTAPGEGMRMIDKQGKDGPLPAFARDEVARYLD